MKLKKIVQTANYKKYTPADKYLILSIHEVSPIFEPEIKKIIAELDKRRLAKFSLLITPNWHDESVITDHSGFIKDIKRLEHKGAELILHGYNHHGNIFTHIARNEAKTKLGKAMKLFKQAFGFKPNGFIPPFWRLSNESYRIIKKNFRYTETFAKLEYFSGKTIIGLPLGMEGIFDDHWFDISRLFTRILSNIYGKMIWNRNGAVRYTIHPKEVNNGNFDATLRLLDIFLKKGWKPVTYSELERL